MSNRPAIFLARRVRRLGECGVQVVELSLLSRAARVGLYA